MPADAEFLCNKAAVLGETIKGRPVFHLPLWQAKVGCFYGYSTDKYTLLMYMQMSRESDRYRYRYVVLQVNIQTFEQ